MSGPKNNLGLILKRDTEIIPNSDWQVQLQDVLERQEIMDDNVQSVQRDMKELMKDNQRMKALLQAIAEHNNIDLVAEDDD